MPSKTTVKKATEAKRQGKAPTTQAGAFVEEEMRHAKSGKHPVKSRKQAIAIGLSKARKEGVKVPKKRGSSSTSSARRPTASKGRRGTSGTRTSRTSSKSRSTGKKSSASKSR